MRTARPRWAARLLPLHRVLAHRAAAYWPIARPNIGLLKTAAIMSLMDRPEI